MADDPVVKIYGIGKVTSEALTTHGVMTVSQLAALEPGELTIPNLATLIHRAKEYLKLKKMEGGSESTGTVGPKMMMLSGASAASLKDDKQLTRPKNLFAPQVTAHKPAVTAATAPSPLHDKETEKKTVVRHEADTTTAEAKEMFMIADHSWYETRVVVPRQDSLAEAIVYELGVEPNERIAFVCTWVTSEGVKRSQDRLHTMTYSPQLLLHFNLDLPPLRVSIREEDFKALPNQHTLTNVLWEVEMMQSRL